MKDKLRELAERLDVLAHAVAEANWSEFSMRVPVEPERDADCVLSQAAIELRSYAAILDAEGDGGTVAWQDKVNEIANNIGESLNAGCDQDAVNRINVYVDELFALTAHPARSGVVSDEDVEAACIIAAAKTDATYPWAVYDEEERERSLDFTRAALEHFAAIAQEKQS